MVGEATIEPPVPRAPSRGSLWLRFGVAGALLAYLMTSDAIDWSAFSGLGGELPLVAAALGAIGVSMVVTALRLPTLLRPMGYALAPRAAVQLALMGMFFGLFLPGSASGDAAKIFYAVSGQERGTRAELATFVLFDRAVGMWAMFAMPLLAVALFPEWVAGESALATLLRFSIGVFALGSCALALVLMLPARALSWVPSSLARRSLAAVRGYRSHPRALLSAFTLSVGAHSAAIGATALVAAAIVPESMRPELVLVVPLGFVANALPLTPGGLGVGELAFHRLFEAVGMTGGAEVAVGWRMGIVLFSLLGGLLYVRGFRNRIGRLEPEGPGEGS